MLRSTEKHRREYWTLRALAAEVCADARAAMSKRNTQHALSCVPVPPLLSRAADDIESRRAGKRLRNVRVVDMAFNHPVLES